MVVCLVEFTCFLHGVLFLGIASRPVGCVTVMVGRERETCLWGRGGEGGLCFAWSVPGRMDRVQRLGSHR